MCIISHRKHSRVKFPAFNSNTRHLRSGKWTVITDSWTRIQLITAPPPKKETSSQLFLYRAIGYFPQQFRGTIS